MMSWRAARRSLARPRAAAPRPRHSPQRLPCRPTTLAASEAAPTVTVYLDMKSPHAYLILAPALQVARDYHVKVEFKPYELSFVDMGDPTHPPPSPPQCVTGPGPAPRRHQHQA